MAPISRELFNKYLFVIKNWTLVILLMLSSVYSQATSIECKEWYQNETFVVLHDRYSRTKFSIYPERIIPEQLAKGRNIFEALDYFYSQLKSQFLVSSTRGAFKSKDVLAVAYKIQDILKRTPMKENPTFTMFGSYVNGKAHSKSDIDIMASLKGTPNSYREFILNQLAKEIKMLIKDLNLPEMPVNFEPIDLEYRGDFAGFNNIFIEITADRISLLIVPSTSIKTDSKSYFGETADLTNDAIRITLP